MFDVCALGELLIDWTPSGRNEQGVALFGQNPGGAPANVLAMTTKLGGKTVFIGKVGGDAFGGYLEKTLLDAGIDASGLIKDPRYLTTLAFVNLTEAGDRSFSFYRRQGADLMLEWDEINKTLIDSAKIFHFGSLSLTDEPCRQTTHKAVSYAKSNGKIVSYDPNYRPLLWKNQDEAAREIVRLIPQADILKVSEEEMELITGKRSIEAGAAELAAQGPAVVLVSLGREGAFFCCAAGSAHLKTYDVKTIDTTGAGDAFLGAILYKLKDKSRGQLESISKDELSAIVDFGNAAGSLTTAKRGAIPALPLKNEIETLLSEKKRLL
ncbi:MAG: carbohydrate kinase [Spirochaetaceae bacterium]|jgi:fructokinase|nr:carbohydrate kinase [Spirochaetaceae bacterium]